MNSEIGRELKQGVVESFDSHRGLGVIDAAGLKYLFHCAEITDGTREIALNIRVSFIPVRRFGNLEASAVTALASENL